MNPFDWTDEMVKDWQHSIKTIAFVGCLGVLGVSLVALAVFVIVGWFIQALIALMFAAGVAFLALDLGLSLEENR